MKIKNVKGFVVGINDFVGTGNDLAGCVNDANDIARLLRPVSTMVGDAIDTTPFFHCSTQVTMLLDSQATLKAATAVLKTFVASLEPEELGFIWFSQHGTFVKDLNRDEPDGTDEALVFQDLGLMIDDEVGKILAKRKSGSYIFLGTDSCHSGTVQRLYQPVDRKPERKVRYLPPERLPLSVRPTISQMRALGAVKANQAPLQGVIHFAGCQDTEYCYDAQFKSRPNGAFTYYLLRRALQALKPGATFGDWFTAVRGFLPSVEYPQSPKCNAYSSMLALPLPLRKG